MKVERYSEKVILDLIGLVYDAAGDATRWTFFLERLRKAVGSAVATLYVQDLRNQKFNATASIHVGMDPDYMGVYADYYASKNVFLIHGKDLLRSGSVCASQTLCPDEIAFRSEFYNEWILPQGLGQGLNGVIVTRKSLTSMIGAIRGKRAKPFRTEEASLLRVLMPHLQRAVQLHLRITELETRERAETDALNRWSMGVILLDAQGRVLLMNRSGEAIVNQKDGLMTGAYGLRAALSGETLALSCLIHDAIQTSLGHGCNAGGALALSRPSLKRPLQILVTPNNSHMGVLGETGAVCAVFVSDPETREETDKEVLHRLYGLSRAEADVASLLVEGNDVRQVSEELNVSLNTARTHLKRVFEKTGTRRQAELVRLLHRSPAFLRLRP